MCKLLLVPAAQTVTPTAPLPCGGQSWGFAGAGWSSIGATHTEDGMLGTG